MPTNKRKKNPEAERLLVEKVAIINDAQNHIRTIKAVTGWTAAEMNQIVGQVIFQDEPNENISTDSKVKKPSKKKPPKKA